MPQAIFNEAFEAVGYQETWSEGEDIDPGNSLDPNFDSSLVTGVPANWTSQCLEAINLGTGGIRKAVVEDQGIGARPIIFVRVEFILGAINPVQPNELTLFRFEDSGHKEAFRCYIKTAGGFAWLFLDARHDNAPNVYQYTSNFMSPNIHFSVEVRWDNVIEEWEWRVNGVNQPNNVDGSVPATSPGTLTGAHAAEISEFYLGLDGLLKPATVYFNLIHIHTDDWPGHEPDIPTDWMTSNAADRTHRRAYINPLASSRPLPKNPRRK